MIDRDMRKIILRAGYTGATVAASIGGFCYIGYYVDQWLHTEPWCLIIGGVIGGFGGIYLLYKEAVT